MKEWSYWMAFAHLPKWRLAKINALISRILFQEKITIEDFFHLDEAQWKNTFGLTTPNVNDLVKAKSDLANLAFLAEELFHAGYEILPLHSPDYSPALKKHLGSAHAPIIIYIKGNKQLMEKTAVAIVGSRGASETSLKFTENIVKLAFEESKVIVSGYAKGVDKKALDSSVECGGQSIIVLPQGILTFSSGFKTYYKSIIEGNILIVSTFPPKVLWKSELAMARNPIIYGMADEVYVAESSEKGGTWSGVIDGLRKKRRIYVRKADEEEKNANNLLIQKGATAVTFEGKEIISSTPNTLF